VSDRGSDHGGRGSASLPKVAVIGRSNVGKSTLVNRLMGRRLAIVHESPGATRDRVEAIATWNGRSLVVIDTGGVVERPAGMDASIARQSARAVEAADLALLVVDAPAGISAEDEALARGLRAGRTPVLVVANKVDSQAQEPFAAEFYALGLGEPMPVSALHGRGSGELLDRILEILPPQDTPALLEDEARFCLVGRPNVGKSSLFNRLVDEERAIVHEAPGTTRDSVDEVVEVLGRRIRFVDTAGLRRPGRSEGVEYYSLVRSLRAVDAAAVALLVVDASEGLTGEDKRIAARVAEAGRGLVATLNKWDLVPSEERAGRFIDLGRELALFPGTPVLRTSALTGSGVKRVVPALLAVHAVWRRRVPTAEVNRVLTAAVESNPPPRRSGRVLYATQVSAGPPTFVVFGAREPGPTYRRYLENTLRSAFGFAGVPVRISFRGRQPRGSAGSGAREPSARPARRGQ
jgi:GTPase